MNIVYLITCISSGEEYVGLTKQSMSARWAQHRYDARSGRTNKPLSETIREHGESGFSIRILARGDEATAGREVEEIESRGTLHPGGLNADTGGIRGHSPSDGTRRRMSESAKKRCADPEARDRLLGNLAKAREARWASDNPGGATTEARKRGARKRKDFIHNKDEIRAKYAEGGISQDALAKELGISQSAVSLIILDKR